MRKLLWSHESLSLCVSLLSLSPSPLFFLSLSLSLSLFSLSPSPSSLSLPLPLSSLLSLSLATDSPLTSIYPSIKQPHHTKYLENICKLTESRGILWTGRVFGNEEDSAGGSPCPYYCRPVQSLALACKACSQAVLRFLWLLAPVVHDPAGIQAADNPSFPGAHCRMKTLYSDYRFTDSRKTVTKAE